VTKVYSPRSFQNVTQDMNTRGNRGWVIDDHDFAVEFYFRSLEDLSKVSQDPEFHALQASEAPYVSQHHVVTSLSWVETFVEKGQVIHIENGESTYGSFEEMSKLEMDANYRKPAAQQQ
jgi:EthD domain